MRKLILLAAAVLGIWVSSIPAAASEGSLLSVTGESQIQPMDDDSGKYMLKSNGFYCLNEDGSAHNTAAVHYFDDYVIDGTMFRGYYYHDGEGKFKGNPSHLEHLTDLSVPQKMENSDMDDLYEIVLVFDGYYMVNNLGKLSAAPQVRYIDNFTLENTVLNGWYYFNENGRLDTSNEMHYVDMVCNGRTFEGYYYFGGENGALVQESGVTPEGFPVDEDGLVAVMENLGMETLKPQLRKMLLEYDGTWGLYVKNLDTGEHWTFNYQSLYSASLIKAFVMAETYLNMDAVLEHEAAKMNTSPDNTSVQEKVYNLLWNMITISDNESFNELVRLQSKTSDFKEGAEIINEHLEEENYTETSVQHTLHPANSAQQGIGGRNLTSVEDCGKLLESIYNGECVSTEASKAMLELLLNQKNLVKIAAGLPEGVTYAGKTGDTDQSQHDIAIISGPKTTYILCVMSDTCPDEGDAIDHIRDISKIVYSYLNL